MGKTLDITFERNYHVSLEDRFLMEKVIIHKSVDIGEDSQQVLDKAREEAELNHRRNNPHLFPPDIPIIPKSSKGMEFIVNKESPNQYNKEPTLEEQINSCTDAAILTKTYKFIVKGKKDLEDIYNAKLRELQ